MSENSREVSLIGQAVAGDRGALSQLLLHYTDDLERHVAQLLSRDPHETVTAEDILQQTFVRAAMAVGRYEQRAGISFGAWLRTISGNLVRDAQRRRRREKRLANENGVPPDEPANSTSPSMRVHRRDSLSKIRDALADLPDDQREVLERHYLQHESLDQIATAMNRSKDAIRGICYRARQRLRSSLGHSSWFFSS